MLIIVFLFQINNLFAQVGVAARKGCGRRWSVWFESKQNLQEKTEGEDHSNNY